MDRDGIYERDWRDVEIDEDRESIPREHVPPAGLDFYPIDDDEIVAAEHFGDLCDQGSMTSEEAEYAYKTFVRRRRRGLGDGY